MLITIVMATLLFVGVNVLMLIPLAHELVQEGLTPAKVMKDMQTLTGWMISDATTGAKKEFQDRINRELEKAGRNPFYTTKKI